MSRLEQCHPSTPAQREAAVWLLGEMRAEVDRTTPPTYTAVRGVVERHLLRVSPALAGLVARLAGARFGAEFPTVAAATRQVTEIEHHRRAAA